MAVVMGSVCLVFFLVVVFLVAFLFCFIFRVAESF